MPDVVTLYDFTYWANRHLLDVAATLTPEQWTAPSDITTRDLRGTVVHTLDVEWSWRLPLQRRPKAEWGPDVEHKPADYPDVAMLAAHWAQDEREMRAWFGTFDDAALASGWSDATPQAGKPLRALRSGTSCTSSRTASSSGPTPPSC
jgi:uncharacterized damage-inducible protein DinB